MSAWDLCLNCLGISIDWLIDRLLISVILKNGSSMLISIMFEFVWLYAFAALCNIPKMVVVCSHILQCFNPAAAGPPRHPPVAGGRHKVAPLYLCDDIVATRRDREAKLCTHLPEYLAEVVSKFGVDPI